MKKLYSVYVLLLLILGVFLSNTDAGTIARCTKSTGGTSFTEGTIPTAVDWNCDHDTVFSEINGNLADVNISATAAIAGTKLRLGVTGIIFGADTTFSGNAVTGIVVGNNTSIPTAFNKSVDCGSTGFISRLTIHLDATCTTSVPSFGRVVRTAGDVSTTSTSLVDLTGASITLTTGAFPVAIGFTGIWENPGSTNRMTFDLDSGTQDFGTNGFMEEDVTGLSPIMPTSQTAALSAGSHTFKVRWNVSAGTGTIRGNSTNSYMFWAHEIR